MAQGSQKPTFKDYQVKPVCHGCGRKLVAAHETQMLFQGHPFRAVWGSCCWPARKEAA